MGLSVTSSSTARHQFTVANTLFQFQRAIYMVPSHVLGDNRAEVSHGDGSSS